MKTYKVIRNDGTPSRRKFEGFNFYIQCNEKLSRRNRKELISKSEVYLNKIFNSIQTLIDLDTDIHKGLTPNRIGDNNYLEKQLDNLLNDISITVRTNSKSQYLEQVLLKIPSDCYRRIP